MPPLMPTALRWGGALQDKDKAVVSEEHWQALAKLTREANVRHIIGVNLRVKGWQW